MIEIRGDKKVLITPISEEDLADIKIGDIVWLDGHSPGSGLFLRAAGLPVALAICRDSSPQLQESTYASDRFSQ